MKELDIGVDIQEACPTCGLDRSKWKENSGAGYTTELGTYCSAECALKDQAT